MKKLKPLGLHHGLPVFITSWALCFYFNPSVGIYAAIIGAGYYTGREEKEAEMRGFRPSDPSTWHFKHFELPDFLMPCTLAAFNVWIMSGM